jgi:hypothetical protein
MQVLHICDAKRLTAASVTTKEHLRAASPSDWPGYGSAPVTEKSAFYLLATKPVPASAFGSRPYTVGWARGATEGPSQA